jgi:hypothetical protein
MDASMKPPAAGSYAFWPLPSMRTCPYSSAA